ncbi:MAG: iron ABC transporter permease [Bacteriovorax sp.]|nr:iron ABC transporter permease [Bacteriovorax sp.]
MKNKLFLLLVLVLLLMFFLIGYGESGFEQNRELILQLRLPKVVVCLFAGGILAIAGLLMQTFFQNPLAGPDTLGVSSGSSLFVALWLMTGAGSTTMISYLGMSAMSFLGAFVVFLFLLFFMQRNMSKVSLIIVGVLISSFTSSGISILVNMSSALQLKSFLVWSMGSFRNVTTWDLPLFVIFSCLSLVPVFLFIKPLNQYLLSENYAKSMGVNIKRTKIIFVTVAAFQISIITLFCGPIGFVGIIAPHLARNFLQCSQLPKLCMATFFIGSGLALFAECVLVLNPSISFSVNAILGLIGAPVVILYLYRQHEWGV